MRGILAIYGCMIIFVALLICLFYPNDKPTVLQDTVVTDTVYKSYRRVNDTDSVLFGIETKTYKIPK